MSEGQALPEGTVTVLFTDLVGSTQLNQTLGDEAAGALEGEIETTALERVSQHRGFVVKDTGDGLMVAFQSARRVGVPYEVITEMSEMTEPITAVGHRFQDVITAAVVD